MTVGATVAAVLGFVLIIGVGIFIGTRRRRTNEQWRKSMILPNNASSRGEKGLSVQIPGDGLASPSGTPGTRSSMLPAGSSAMARQSSYNSSASPTSSIGPASASRLSKVPQSPLRPGQPALHSPQPQHPQQQHPQPTQPQQQHPAQTQQQQYPKGNSPPTPTRQPLLPYAGSPGPGSPVPDTPSIRVVKEQEALSKSRRVSFDNAQTLPYDVPSSMTYPPSPFYGTDGKPAESV